MHKDCVGCCSRSFFLGFQPIFLFEHYYVRKSMSIIKKFLFSYYDYRNGSAEVYTEAGCSASNTALVAVYNVMLMVAKSSTVLFGFAVYIAMFLLTLLLKKKSVNKRKPCHSYITFFTERFKKSAGYIAKCEVAPTARISRGFNPGGRNLKYHNSRFHHTNYNR